MGSLTPEHYKITKDMTDRYTAEIDEYCSKINPICDINDIQNRVAEGNKILGRIDVMLEALNDDSVKRKDWIKRKEDVEKAIENVRAEYKNIEF